MMDDLDFEFNVEFQKLCILLKLYYMLRKEKRQQRRFAVRKLMQERRQKGFYNNLIPRMRISDVETFKNFHRMDPQSVEDLLALLGPHWRNSPARLSEAITQSERLAMTLRYLGSGDSMKSVGFYGFRVGASTTSAIIRETCQLIWEKLQFVFPQPSEEMWNRVADEFYEIWGFPNCLGAIDGKHVVVQAFPNHNSLTYNYKHSHSLLLMAVADAKYKFIMVDIGALGHNSDGGVFRSSKFGNAVLNKPEDLHIPSSKVLPESDECAPFVFVADEAFPLRTNIMRPYPGRNVGNLPEDRMNFNKRLSRARMVVENAFGILSNRFRIYRRPIIASKETAKNIIKATVCLHNWLREKSTSGCSRNEDLCMEYASAPENALLPMPSTRSNHPTVDALAVRRCYTTYFMQNNL